MSENNEGTVGTSQERLLSRISFFFLVSWKEEPIIPGSPLFDLIKSPSLIKLQFINFISELHIYSCYPFVFIAANN